MAREKERREGRKGREEKGKDDGGRKRKEGGKEVIFERGQRTLFKSKR